jgi:peroxiredoxin
MPPMAALTKGILAPEFCLEGIDGRKYDLHHPGQTPTLLVFFKNTCPTCILSFPYLQRLYERAEGAPLRFWGISQDSPAETKVFGEQYGVTFPLLCDGTDYPVSNAYALTNVPTLFLLEPDGTVGWTVTGFVKADLEGLAAEFQRRLRIPGVTPLFVASDDVPAMKPG